MAGAGSAGSEDPQQFDTKLAPIPPRADSTAADQSTRVMTVTRFGRAADTRGMTRLPPSQRMAILGLIVSFGPLAAVLTVLALRGGTTLTPGMALLLLAVIVFGPLLGVLVVVMRTRAADRRDR